MSVEVSDTTVDAAAEPQEQVRQPEINNYTDGYAYEVPRPFLTLQQAAAVLGKSLRSLERSLLGRWGNKLPEGWVARKIKTEQGDEWRILPPPGFRVKMTGTECDTAEIDADSEDATHIFAEPVGAASRKRQLWKAERHTLDQPAIVIDRSEEVENLLRELVRVQHSLSEERRTHMEDLRLITQMQSSMRLLEVNAAEQARAKTELEMARQELSELKQEYNRVVSLPWWRRLFLKGRL